MWTILMHQMCISTTQVSSVMLRSKNMEIQKKNVKSERAQFGTCQSTNLKKEMARVIW
jgi:hypothetical protein